MKEISFETPNLTKEVIKEEGQTLHQVWLIFLSVASVFLLGIGLVFYVGFMTIQDHQRMYREISANNHLIDILSSVKDAETGQRGYLLTNDEAYLEPYNATLSKIQSQIGAFQRYVEGNEIFIPALEHFIELVNQKIKELDLTIELNRTKGPKAALNIVRSNQGKQVMDQIRAEIRGIENQQQKKMAAMDRRIHLMEKLRTGAFIVFGLINLFFLGWASQRIRVIMRQREKISRQVDKQRELLVTTLSSIGDGVIITDERGNVAFINSEAERLTGWSSAQAAGQALPIVFRIVNEETRHIVENPVEKVLRSGATVGLANHTILIKRDGSEIPIDDSAAPIRLSNGQIFGVVLIFRDFTDHKNAEHSLKQLNRELNDLTAHLEKRVEERTKQLEEQAGLLRQLAVELTEVEEEERKRLAQLLHDHLQQLLIAIKIRLELMRKSENLDKTAVAEMSSFVEEAYQSSRTLTAELRPPVLYESGLGAALRFLARKFEKDQKLKIHLSIFADAEPVSDIFKVMIYQSVQEALLNIVKYAGITECSLVMEKVEEKRIHIIVSDKGKGFDPKIIGLKGAGGFGLFSIRERIKALGGECKIISAVGEGTSLEMILPAETKILEPQAVEISQSPILLNKDKERISVLVADDHKIVRQSLARALSLESFIDEVFEASNGKEAVRMVQERRPNVVIMDFNMPEMNGLEATRILHKQYPHIKIIGLSVQAEEEMIQMMREAGAVRFFNKNEDMEVLMKTLKSLL